jgi:undecaprenyl-diphosphatase
MQIYESIILGIVEGLTEYLPVSSTGHLILAEQAMKLQTPENKEALDAYTICIQVGAILAVLGIYFSRVKSMALGVIGKDPAGRALTIKVLAAFFPAAVVGLAFNKKIDAALMNLWTVTIAWLVGGVAILAVEWFKPASRKQGLGLDSLTVKMALMIGLLQCLSLMPGTSRSLVTILGGILVGLSLSAAVEFSFILGLITLTAATAYKSLKFNSANVELLGGATVLIIGIVAAWISAFLAVKWMVSFLQRRGFAVFGYYRVALACVVAIMILSGMLSGE